MANKYVGRDPERIDTVLDAIRVYWKQNPDLRLAQIVGNAANSAGYPSGAAYFMEDPVLVANISDRTRVLGKEPQ